MPLAGPISAHSGFSRGSLHRRASRSRLLLPTQGMNATSQAARPPPAPPAWTTSCWRPASRIALGPADGSSAGARGRARETGCKHPGPATRIGLGFEPATEAAKLTFPSAANRSATAALMSVPLVYTMKYSSGIAIDYHDCCACPEMLPRALVEDDPCVVTSDEPAPTGCVDCSAVRCGTCPTGPPSGTCDTRGEMSLLTCVPPPSV
jgi:hypothetical protein